MTNIPTIERKEFNSEVDEFLQAYPDTSFVDAVLFDLTGKAIGKRYPVRDIKSLYDSGSQFCAGATMLDVTGVCHDVFGIGFSDGDPDAVCEAIPGTLKPIPWLGNSSAQCLIEMKNPDDPMGWWFDPRALLKRVLARLADIGLRPTIACELEFYLVNNQLDEEGLVTAPVVERTGRVNEAPRVLSFEKLDEFSDFLTDVDSACLAQGIPAGAASSEYGVSQYEINLSHTDDVVAACDQALLLRRAVKGVANKNGLNATFMSFPFSGQSGNGLHVHLSLCNESGQNIFSEDLKDGELKLSQAVSGLRHTMYDAMAIFAPNINAYRRFEPDNFVPVNHSWDHNNRSVAFRIPLSSPGSRRIEHRVAGADANPYLVVAAILAGIHYGLTQELEQDKPTQGNAGETVDPEMPTTLWDALERFRHSELLMEYFGERYPAAYADIKAAEFAAFMSQISPREYAWYL